MRADLMRPVRSVALTFACCVLAACSTVPEIDGKKVTEYPAEDVMKAAHESFEAKDWPRAADLSEYLIKNRFKFTKIEDARWIAAESRFNTGAYPDAFIHYQRLLDENPFHKEAPLVSKRVWVIGKTLIEEQSAYFTDFAAHHDVGREALNFLVTKFPQCEYADDAWKELADAFMVDRQFQSAADCYERIARQYPDSEWVDLSLYKVADAYRNQSRGGDFDVDPLLRAHAALDRYLSRMKDGNFTAKATTDRLDLEREIGRRELEIAEFYGDRGNQEGRLVHIANAASRFPETPEAAAARRLLEGSGRSIDRNAADLLKPREDRPPWRRGPVPVETPKPDLGDAGTPRKSSPR